MQDDQGDSILIALVNTTFKQLSDMVEILRKTSDETRNRLTIAEEKMRYMSEDQIQLRNEVRERAKELQDRIGIVENNIIEDQKRRMNTIIGIQGAILLLFVGSIIAYLFLFLPRPH